MWFREKIEQSFQRLKVKIDFVRVLVKAFKKV